MHTLDQSQSVAPLALIEMDERIGQGPNTAPEIRKRRLWSTATWKCVALAANCMNWQLRFPDADLSSDINETNHEPTLSLLIMAVRQNNSALLQLLSNGAYTKEANKRRLLLVVASQDHEAVSQLLRENGADVNKTTDLLVANQIA